MKALIALSAAALALAAPTAAPASPVDLGEWAGRGILEGETTFCVPSADDGHLLVLRNFEMANGQGDVLPLDVRVKTPGRGWRQADDGVPLRASGNCRKGQGPTTRVRFRVPQSALPAPPGEYETRLEWTAKPR
ncbi:hypothetical protein CKO28_18555 [Rhodovibrio sodomensis]|uniref:DUF2147 domain-containing protein n=1 Tax=Rhodovibrio sodomensis TaxID=1088 RepID=A0ABS1DJU6_9PROT|nr:hypothetical protein [Rhodovibrio sodomensis]MBK1670039.1 hypothetical protein [Rhodovibrio sodomensis]